MPTIGRPETSDNKFSSVKMREAQEATGDRLNEIAGNKNTQSGVKFVDRKVHNKMGKDEFLKLLTVQLKHQDPMNPMDQKQFAADLAQFSSLEQLSNMNAKMDGMNKNAPAESKFYAASFLGKTAMTKGTTITFDGEQTKTDIPFVLPNNAKQLIVRIFDEKGQLARQIEMENISKGQQVITWDGMSNDGNPATKGNYNIQVHAWDQNLQPFKAETMGSGMVTGVDFDNGETVLILDGKKRIFLRDVESFRISEENRKEGAPIKAKQDVISSYQAQEK